MRIKGGGDLLPDSPALLLSGPYISFSQAVTL